MQGSRRGAALRTARSDGPHQSQGSARQFVGPIAVFFVQRPRSLGVLWATLPTGEHLSGKTADALFPSLTLAQKQDPRPLQILRTAHPVPQ